MWNFQIVKLRPAKHVVDDRLGGIHPFSRPPQDGQGKRPPGRIAVDARGSGHARKLKHSACQLSWIRPGNSCYRFAINDLSIRIPFRKVLSNLRFTEMSGGNGSMLGSFFLFPAITWTVRHCKVSHWQSAALVRWRGSFERMFHR